MRGIYLTHPTTGERKNLQQWAEVWGVDSSCVGHRRRKCDTEAQIFEHFEGEKRQKPLLEDRLWDFNGRQATTKEIATELGLTMSGFRNRLWRFGADDPRLFASSNFLRARKRQVSIGIPADEVTPTVRRVVNPRAMRLHNPYVDKALTPADWAELYGVPISQFWGDMRAAKTTVQLFRKYTPAAR